MINLQPELQTAMVTAERLNDVLNAEKEQKNTDKEELNFQGSSRGSHIENAMFCPRYHDIDEEIGMQKMKAFSFFCIDFFRHAI